MKKPFVYKKFAKSRDYRRVLEEIETTQRCPFCPENFKYHKKPILKRYHGWLATENSWPYKGAKVHFLVIAARHCERVEELTTRDFSAVASLTRWLVKKYSISGGGLLLRFGDSRFTGASVRHLHFQLVQPSRNKKTGRVATVNFPIG